MLKTRRYQADQCLAHLVSVMALVVENIFQMLTLLSNHHFSCLQKSSRKLGAKMQLYPIKRWSAKNILLDASFYWKPQIDKADEVLFWFVPRHSQALYLFIPPVLIPHTWFQSSSWQLDWELRVRHRVHQILWNTLANLVWA